jgi:hypothetical protein
MRETLSEALGFLRGLGTVQDLEADAARGSPPAGTPKNNTHVHLPPNFSAFDSVAELAEGAAREGLAVLGASNYYFYGVYAPFAALLRERGIFPLFGLEVMVMIEDLRRRGVKVNDPGNPGKTYLCGKGITRLAPMTPSAESLLDTIRRNDGERMARMTARLASIFEEQGIRVDLDAEAVRSRVARRHECPLGSVVLQERHVAQAFQERLFEVVPPGGRGESLERLFGAPAKGDGTDPVRTQNEIRAHLMKAGKPAFVEERYLSFEEGYRLILELGGIPCYPVLADGASPISPFEESPERLAETWRERSGFCVEFIPLRNRVDVLGRYVPALRRAGLVVTAGTEHNTLERPPLEPTALGGQPLPSEVRGCFWEGACVAAAHAVLVLQGGSGYVDAQGGLAPGHATQNERIGRLANLGAAMIERYRRRCAP